MRDWLRLACTPGIGTTLGSRLIAHYGNPGRALAAGEAGWRALGVPTATRAALARGDDARLAEAERWLAGQGHHFVTRDSDYYPDALAQFAPAPPWLFAIGDLELLDRPAIAIVGSRNPSAAGLEAAHEFGYALAQAGLVVVSGLARGIDGAAHEGALAARGMTIAVCGTGLDRVYPARHKALAEQIAEQGLLLSEFALGTLPMRGNFPRRNRVIAGLSVATLVVEAARASGSLITARMASAAGRDVFALPGSIHNPLARGCHQIIREGAKLVETTEHILEDIAGGFAAYRRSRPHAAPAAEPAEAGDGPTAAAASQPPEHAILLDALGSGPTRVDDLVERTGWSADAVSSTLLILELEGHVLACPGGAYTRAG